VQGLCGDALAVARHLHVSVIGRVADAHHQGKVNEALAADDADLDRRVVRDLRDQRGDARIEEIRVSEGR
jgi:hypothetical protein